MGLSEILKMQQNWRTDTGFKVRSGGENRNCDAEDGWSVK